LEEFGTRQWPQRFDAARRLEATDRQGGIPANAQLLRNQFGNGAPQRCADQRKSGAAQYCGAKEEAMNFTELLGNVGLFGGAVMVCLALLSVFSVGMIVDKHRRFRSASRQSEMVKPVFKKFLHGGEIQDLVHAVRLHRNAQVAAVGSAGTIEYRRRR